MLKPGIFGILKYSELFHNCISTYIQNPVMFTKMANPVWPWKFGTLAYWQSWNIQNPDIFKPDTYLEPSQRLKMTCFAKIVTSYNYFFKALYLRSMTEFFDRVLRASLSKYPLICRVISRYVFWNTYWETCQLS